MVSSVLGFDRKISLGALFKISNNTVNLNHQMWPKVTIREPTCSIKNLMWADNMMNYVVFTMILCLHCICVIAVNRALKEAIVVLGCSVVVD